MTNAQETNVKQEPLSEQAFLDTLINLCDDLAWGRPASEDRLFALTKEGAGPKNYVRLAEAFGMMLVKVESREYHRSQLIADLKTRNAELEEAHRLLAERNTHLMRTIQENYQTKKIVGQCEAMRKVIQLALTIARRPINTLILGPTGAGKEVIAKAIHFNSPRREGPFVAVNCTAIPDSLFESEMFGIEKGIATGVNARKGLIEEASGGTLFLDELADMTLPNQAKLLRVLEEREVLRVGSSKPVSVDIKLIAATNANIARANNLYRKELDWMRRMPCARGTKARYRKEAFVELEQQAKRRTEERAARLEVKSGYIGSKIFEAEYVSKSFPLENGGEKVILKDFYYNFSRYEKMGIVGGNGAGKSTFIKMLLGEVKPDEGRFVIGETVRFGYFSQDGMAFDQQMKVIDAVRRIAETIDLGGGRKLTAMQFLTHFLFPPARQQDYIYKLSGGERRRLYLCTVLMQNPNFLILDEPTNDLDIPTLQILEEYLADFKGCVIVVSHDRYFMDRVVDHLLVFKPGSKSYR